MEGTLKVTPEELMTKASELSSAGTTIRNITSSMTDIVNSLSSIWQGDDATAFTTKFNGLQDDIEKVNGKIQEHVNDLNEMASAYKSTSNASTSDAGSLPTDVVV